MNKQADTYEADHPRDIESVATPYLTSTTGASSSSLATASPIAVPTVPMGSSSTSRDTDAAAPPASIYVASPCPLSTSIGRDTVLYTSGSLLISSGVGRHNGFLRTHKVLIVGEAGVGKSNLMHRYCYDQYNPALPSMIGVEFCSHEVDIPLGPVGVTETVVLQLWDTAGQERNGGVISNAFYRNAVGAIIVYDVARRQSLLNVPRWAARVTELAHDDCVCVVVGAKLDLLCAKTSTATMAGSLEAVQQEADRISHAMGMRNFMTSALSGKGVLEAFTHLILAVDAVQAAPRRNNDMSSNQCPTRRSGHGGSAPGQEVQMWTAATGVPASPINVMGGAKGLHRWPGVGGDIASSPLSRAASTPVMSVYTGAPPATGWEQRQLPSDTKKALDLRGFGCAGARPDTYTPGPTCGGTWGC
ncbi:ADP-ribosylation factor family/Ras of Complex, Roc, domain of DAPkinase/Gtr1/RagA G protein conserved region/Ras family, putative [Leishmania lindenbergi]|uniref:ADP-ribosylation factor family/Ras of Complex, Roc, domain of DAPkinase/Gtr1 n=1 Tax=Leishmania lindenbergi TaxID=651832 RepID=A0AAW3APM4_9TRYP